MIFEVIELTKREEGLDLSPKAFKGEPQAPAFCWKLLLFFKFACDIFHFIEVLNYLLMILLSMPC